MISKNKSPFVKEEYPEKHRVDPRKVLPSLDGPIEDRPMGSEVERVAKRAMEMARKQLGEYGSIKSRKDFTHHQLMALMVLRLHLQTTYRGLIDFLAGHGHIREILEIETKLPHYTTLQKFGAREGVQRIAEKLLIKLRPARSSRN